MSLTVFGYQVPEVQLKLLEMQVYDAVMVSIIVQPGICQSVLELHSCFSVSNHIRAKAIQYGMKIRVPASNVIENGSRSYTI